MQDWKLQALIAVLMTTATLMSVNYVNSSNSLSQPPDTVPYVNLTKYAGKWWQQAKIPMRYQKKCKESFAVYIPSDKVVNVQNFCLDEDEKTLSSIKGQATPEDSTNSKLKLVLDQKFFKVHGQYWVVMLGDDYEYSVVTDPSY